MGESVGVRVAVPDCDGVDVVETVGVALEVIAPIVDVAVRVIVAVLDDAVAVTDGLVVAVEVAEPVGVTDADPLRMGVDVAVEVGDLIAVVVGV